MIHLVINADHAYVASFYSHQDATDHMYKVSGTDVLAVEPKGLQVVYALVSQRYPVDDVWMLFQTEMYCLNYLKAIVDDIRINNSVCVIAYIIHVKGKNKIKLYNSAMNEIPGAKEQLKEMLKAAKQ